MVLLMVCTWRYTPRIAPMAPVRGGPLCYPQTPPPQQDAPRSTRSGIVRQIESWPGADGSCFDSGSTNRGPKWLTGFRRPSGHEILTTTATRKYCIPQSRLVRLYDSDMPVTAGDTKRITLDLSREEHRALKLLALEQDIPMAELLRAVIAELREDDALLRRVSKRAG